MTELLKQPQYRPYDIIDQVLSIFAGTKGYLDSLPVPQVLPFEKALLRHFHDEFPEVVDELRDKKKISDELEEKMRKIVSEYKVAFLRERDVEEKRVVSEAEAKAAEAEANSAATAGA
jgi:F-type H+-transporting ATPase subunit alpha